MSQNLIIALAFALLLVILIVYEYSKKKSTSLLTPDNATLSATAGATTLPAAAPSASSAANVSTSSANATTVKTTPSKADVYNAIMADPDVLKSALATGMSKTEFIHEITVLSAAMAALSPSDYKSQVLNYTTHHQAFSGVIWP